MHLLFFEFLELEVASKKVEKNLPKATKARDEPGHYIETNEYFFQSNVTNYVL